MCVCGVTPFDLFVRLLNHLECKQVSVYLAPVDALDDFECTKRVQLDATAR